MQRQPPVLLTRLLRRDLRLCAPQEGVVIGEDTLVRNEPISKGSASEVSGNFPSMSMKCRWGPSVLPSLPMTCPFSTGSPGSTRTPLGPFCRWAW